MHRVPLLDSTGLGLHVHIIIIKVEGHAYGPCSIIYGLLRWIALLSRIDGSLCMHLKVE